MVTINQTSTGPQADITFNRYRELCVSISGVQKYSFPDFPIHIRRVLVLQIFVCCEDQIIVLKKGV